MSISPRKTVNLTVIGRTGLDFALAEREHKMRCLSQSTVRFVAIQYAVRYLPRTVEIIIAQLLWIYIQQKIKYPKEKTLCRDDCN